MASVTDETAADSIRVAMLFGVNGSSATSYTETAALSLNVGYGMKNVPVRLCRHVAFACTEFFSV
jgi:hypothetical protein